MAGRGTTGRDQAARTIGGIDMGTCNPGTAHCTTECLFTGTACEPAPAPTTDAAYSHVYNGDAASYGVEIVGRAGAARRVRIVCVLAGESSIPAGTVVRVTGSRVVTRGRWAVAS